MAWKLKCLRVRNFKSYCGDHDIGPFLSFTCIVGPNGAGKSNVMDALSFVLGASAATLRGRELADCINRDATTPECVVTLHFADSGTGKTLDLARRVTRDGQMSVLVDGRVVSASAFNKELMTLNIANRISSFLVFQHEVEAVAQKRAKELTELLEGISGSADLRMDYDTKKRTMETANEALMMASMEKRGAVAEVRQMKLLKQEAERYEETKRRYDEEKRNLALTELLYVETQLSSRKTEYAAAAEHLDSLAKTMTSEQELQRMKKEYAENQKAYLGELKKNRQMGHEMRDMQATLDRINAARDHLRRKHETLQRELETLESAQSIRSKETARLHAQLEHHQALLDQFEEGCRKEDAEAQASGRKLTSSQLEEYRRLRTEADCLTVAQRQELDTFSRRRESLVEGLKQCRIAKDNQLAQAADNEAAVQRSKARVAELHQRIEDLQGTATMLESKITQTRVDLLRNDKKVKEHDEKVRRLEEQLHELQFVKENNSHNTRMAEALQALRAFSGIHGRLVDLCTIPNDKYRNAVTVAMGKNLEAVVVDTAAVAMSCVRYLKEQRLAVMTFLPLDSIEGAAVDDRLRTFGGSCKPVVDVITYDPILEPAVRFAVGKTLVCDTIGEAQRVAFDQPSGERHKVVTVDGSMLLRNGAIQGGLANVQARARRWDEKRYHDLRAEYEKLLGDASGASGVEVTRMQAEMSEAESRLEFTKARVKALNSEVASATVNIESLLRETSKQAETMHDIEAREAKYTAALEECEVKMLQLQKAIAERVGTIFASFQQQVGIPNVAEFEQREAKKAKIRAERRQELQLLTHRLKSALEAEEKRVGIKPLGGARDACHRVLKEIQQCDRDFTTYRELTQQKEKEHIASQKKVAAAKVALDRLEETIRKESASGEAELKKLADARKSATMLKAMCDALRLQRQNIVRRCQMDDTVLPLIEAPAGGGSKPSAATPGPKRGRMDTAPVGAPASAAARHESAAGGPRSSAGAIENQEPLMLSESFSTTTQGTLSPMESSDGSTGGGGGSAPGSSMGAPESRKGRGAAEVRVDFSGLPDSLRLAAVDRSHFTTYRQRAEGLIAALHRELESLAPNLKASTRFVSSENKLESTATQLDEVRERARVAHAEFVRVKELRTQRFMETFEKVAASVDRVYRELTLDTRGHAVHGSAYLTLEDAEEPYLGGTKYHVTPPMKRFMAMDSLSGGERTMAALALLFSIHAVSPAPYFVLDEVDAALDYTNVQKLAHYVRRSAASGSVQYIVISLKEQFYHMADSLVGVMKDKAASTSRALSFDLRSYA